MTQTHISPISLKRPRKKQEDRLLKQLSYGDRRRQMRMRQQILDDPLFLAV